MRDSQASTGKVPVAKQLPAGENNLRVTGPLPDAKVGSPAPAWASLGGRRQI